MSPPGKKIGEMTCESVVTTSQRLADRDRRAVVHRARGRPSRSGSPPGRRATKTSSISARIARPPAPCFILMSSSWQHDARPVLAASRSVSRSGWPPYWCQIRQVPSLETMHAPTGESGTHSLPKSAQSCGEAMPAMMSPQMHCCASADGALAQSAARSIVEAAARVDDARTRRAVAGCRSGRGRCRASVRRSDGRPSTASPARGALPSRVTQRGNMFDDRRRAVARRARRAGRGPRGCRAARSRRRRPECRAPRRTPRRRPSR